MRSSVLAGGGRPVRQGERQAKPVAEDGDDRKARARAKHAERKERISAKAADRNERIEKWSSDRRQGSAATRAQRDEDSRARAEAAQAAADERRSVQEKSSADRKQASEARRAQRDEDSRSRAQAAQTAAAERSSAQAQKEARAARIELARQQVARQTAAAGGWWLAPKAFAAFGFMGYYSVNEVQYLGGWAEHPKTYTGSITKSLKLDSAGISLRGLKTIFTIPWDQVVELEVEGPEVASSRITATRLLALGPFALAARKKSKEAVLVVRTRRGDEALFHVEKVLASEMRAKLLPVISQVRRANPPTASAASGGVADELGKLAQLRDVGVLTSAEFDAQKGKLLG